MSTNGLERVAIIDGLRSPFQKQATGFTGISALQLGQQVVNELFARSDLPRSEIELLVFGQVIQSPKVPNIAREIVLATGLDERTDAYSVSKACATSFQSVACIAQAIECHQIATGIAGGADSSSVLPVQLSDPLAFSLLMASKARSIKQKLSAFIHTKPKHFIPQAPAIAEYSTGLSMGQSAEQMAKTYGITREAQESFALSSHQKAADAWDRGDISPQIVATSSRSFKQSITKDNCYRTHIDPEKIKALPPVFDQKHGTITSATSSPLTDGAAALLLMSEQRAAELQQPVLTYIKDYAFIANRVSKDLLMGPAHAINKVLSKSGLSLKEMDLIEMHEAFAAQVLVNLQQMNCRAFANEHGYKQVSGEVNMDTFNVLGGSLAYGHPFAATGARMLMQTARELKRRGGQFALVSACAAGGLGVAFIIETAH